VLTKTDGLLTKTDGALTKTDGVLTKTDGTLTKMDRLLTKTGGVWAMWDALALRTCGRTGGKVFLTLRLRDAARLRFSLYFCGEFE